MGKKPPLKLVKPPPVTGPPPSRSLGKAGSALWSTIMSEYDISDSGARSGRLAVARSVSPFTSASDILHLAQSSWLGVTGLSPQS